MKIRKLYMEDFLKAIEEKGYTYVYCDETGKYKIDDLGINICVWNGYIEMQRYWVLHEQYNSLKELFEKYTKFMLSTKTYWYEEDLEEEGVGIE